MADYPHQFELFVFYRIYQIYINKSISDISANIDFLNNDIVLYRNIAMDYYYYLYANKVIIKFDDLFKMSRVATTLCSLKKLFGYKVLNLETTMLMPCCSDCWFDILNYLTTYRFNRKYDDLLCYNYNEIKSFLKFILF